MCWKPTGCAAQRHGTAVSVLRHIILKRNARPQVNNGYFFYFVLAREEIFAIDWPPRAASTEDACRLSTVTEKNTAQVNCELELF